MEQTDIVELESSPKRGNKKKLIILIAGVALVGICVLAIVIGVPYYQHHQVEEAAGRQVVLMMSSEGDVHYRYCLYQDTDGSTLYSVTFNTLPPFEMVVCTEYNAEALNSAN